MLLVHCVLTCKPMMEGEELSQLHGITQISEKSAPSQQECQEGPSNGVAEESLVIPGKASSCMLLALKTSQWDRW